MGLSQQIGASSLIKPGVIDNSTQRPASPYEGQAIYQKDTDEVLFYNGTSWSRPWNMPWGVVGYVKRTAGNLSFSTAADLTGMAVTFTAVAGRAYQASWLTTGQKISSAGWTAIYCYVGATIVGSVYDTVGGNEYWNCSASATITGQSGSITVKLRGECSPDTSNLFAGGDPAYLTVEDIGPA